MPSTIPIFSALPNHPLYRNTVPPLAERYHPAEKIATDFTNLYFFLRARYLYKRYTPYPTAPPAIGATATVQRPANMPPPTAEPTHASPDVRAAAPAVPLAAPAETPHTAAAPPATAPALVETPA